MSTRLVALGPPATLAQVLERIAAMDSLSSQRRHDLMSAVRRVARLLDSLPADIPADPEALKRRLGILTPTAAGMTRSRWRNVRALLTTAPRADRRQSHARSTPRRPGAAMACSA